jgi:membrane protein YdbS with pleckstrin-like domain
MDHDPESCINGIVDPGSLPDYREVRLRRLATAYVPYAVLSATRVWLLLALAVLVWPQLPVAGDTETLHVPPWLSLLLLAAAAWFAALAWLDARRRGWAVREHDLIYRSGIIWQRTVIVPFARIQHVETTSGPLERLFGLMRVKCFTAGGAGGDLTVTGLDAASARQVRQYLLEQIRDDESEPAYRLAADGIAERPDGATHLPADHPSGVDDRAP